MIVRDIREAPEPAGLPSVSSLVYQLASEDPVTACKAIRDMRRLMDFFEGVRLPVLMQQPGMSVRGAALILGKSVPYVKARISPDR